MIRTVFALAFALSVCVIMLLSGCGGGGSSTASPGGGVPTNSWVFTPDNNTLNFTGVSAGAIRMKDGAVRIYMWGDGAPEVYQASDGLNFVKLSHGAFPLGVDPNPVFLTDSSIRIYYRNDVNGSTSFWSSSSPDGLTGWSSPVTTGINSPQGTASVPGVVQMADGTMRLYWCGKNGTLSGILSATSVDGINFTLDAGLRASSDYVDPQILKADPSDWLAVFSTRPGFGLQKLHLATSTDGLNWNIDPTPLVAINGRNIVDPTSIRLSAKSFRIYYSVSAGTDPFTGPFTIYSGVLTLP